MASQLFTRSKSSSYEMRLRRNRLRKVLLETLERRELLAADLLAVDSYTSTLSQNSLASAEQPLAFTSLSSGQYSGYSVTDFLDSQFGGSGQDLTQRPWFHLVEESYDQWSRQLGLQSSLTVDHGLTGEGEDGLMAEGEAGGPRLLSVAPNSGDIFTFNNTNRLTEAPTELVFRFDGSSDLNAATLRNGIRIIRAGGDGVFGNANDSVLTPGYLGFGDNNRIVVLRFASTLQDDLYRVELIGEDNAAQGLTAIKNAAGLKLQTRTVDATPNDLTRDSVDFDLELGAQVLAVVPQPVDRVGGVLTPQRDVIRVFFNNDDLYPTAVTTGAITPNPSVVDPAFYQLILTADTVQPSDDIVFAPASISYDPATDMAELKFASPIDQLAGAGTYRLRVGTRDAVVSSTNPQPVLIQSPADPAGNIANAFPLGTLSAAFSTVINQNIVTTSTNDLPLDFPGSNFEPGHRDIQDESHLLGGGDSSPGISQQTYNFALNRAYGLDSAGRPVNTSITPDQIQRVREIFEFYSSIIGVDFVETESSGLTIVVGDLFPLGGTRSRPGFEIGLAGGGLAIMDGAETWDNSFGGRSGIPGAQNFFETAMHEVGHLLGYGHTYDLPPGTIMGDAGDLADPNPGIGSTEWAFPGEADIIHGQYMYRPDNRDVDTYTFVVPAGQAGRLTAETISERLPNSSNLDTYLTLMKQKPGGGVEILAVNNDSNSSDSFLAFDLTEGTYFISVTGKGNENFDPVVPNTGSGAVSQGAYQLKLDFKPTVAAAGVKFSIEDTSGTPLDGDGDGQAGGNFNFWFRTAAPVGVAAANQPKTIYVDKSFTGSQSGAALGSPTQPLNNLDFTNPLKWPVGLLQPGDIVRVLGSDGASTSRPAYEIGRGGVGNQVLSDGLALEVPRGVTMMIDAGAIFKLQGTRISTGSLSASINKSLSALQVLGTPQQTVNFTSYRDESQGTDTNPLNTTPGAGDWGGIDFHEDVDRREGFGSYERKGIFLNYVSNADIRYGGGQITVSTPSPTINPINLSESRPTLLNNTIRFSSDAAISADPNSFEETRFSEPRYQLAESFSPDYARVGPVIRGNTLLNNSTNGLFIKTSTVAGGPLTTLDTAARLDDTDITYVLGENLIIKGTPGGALQETVGPDVSLVQRSGTTGGSLAAGAAVRYRLTAVDLNGAEGVPSAATVALTLAATDSAVNLVGLPKASGDYVSRRLWRSINNGPFQLVAELDSGTTTYKDIGTTLAGALPAVIPTSVNRARLDARLQIDPGVVIKSTGSRIEAGIGAQLIAEGTPDRPIVFTSRFDDRYGAGGTFDTNSDGSASNPGAGNWGGLVARHLSTMSIDNALITFGGGVTSVAGGFAGFSVVEIHQAEARVANSRLEVNGSGLGGNVGSSRDGHGPNDASVIFVVGSQPVLINNTIQNNSVNNTAVISVNANAMNMDNVSDLGRQTGAVARNKAGLGNVGPLVDGNRLLGNGLNGLRVRGETLATETVWDDTDMVHILQSEIVVPDFHTYGGIRLQSKADESLVVKLGTNAGITALGRPLDITDRIGGSLRIVGTPGFPVVMTSIKDDTVGAGFDPNGRALVDTNNNGPSVGVPGDWRSIRLEPYANDRNVDSIVELETDQIQDTGTNDVTGVAQNLGALASTLSGGDENLRLGVSVDGSIAAPQDLDVYSFSATAGTPVWIDIDQTNGSLDSVVELIDASGQIIAQSNNSLAESAGTEIRFVTADTTQITSDRVLGLEKDPFAPSNSFLPGTDRDLYSVNPRDAGMRIILPGATGARNTYYIRVRSSNLAPGDAASKLQNPADERKGLTTGNYRLQVRLQQTDEVPGSTVRYADIRFATNGIETRGMNANSPLLGQLAETGATTALGNIANSDRGSVTVSGVFDDDAVDIYSFTVRRSGTQVIDPSTPTPHIATTFDIDYADGFGRPDTTLWVFNSANQLVLVGTDSNIADDQAAPAQGSDLDDLTRGSNGARDPFIGAAELPSGNYTVVVSNNSQYAQTLNQFQQSAATSPLVRLEPINSVQRISEDRFEIGALRETATGPVQVSFANNGDNAANNQQLVQWTLADMTAFVLQSTGLLMFANPYTGAREADVSDASNTVTVGDLAMSPDGLLVASEIFANNPIDSNTGNLLTLNQTGTVDSATIPVGSTVAGNSGLQTFTAQQTAGGANPTYAIQQRDHGNTQGNVPQGDGFVFNGLTYATADNQELKLFGVGSRQRGALSFNLPVTDANNNVVGILQDAASGNAVQVFNTTNVVYKLNPTTGAVINPGTTPVADRTALGLVGNHAGTQKVEFGRFLSGSVADPNGPYTAGTVTGLAQVGNTLYAVSNLGEFYAVNIGDGDASFPANETVNNGDMRYSGRRATTVVTDGGNPVAFTSLTRGPRNLEGGRYANMLFATTANGTIYALGTNGSLQPVFPGFSYKVQSTDRGGLGNNVVGLDFSPLDVNLFHLTDRRDNEDGHGRPVPYDNSQAAIERGDRALYFGFEDSRTNTGAQRQQGDWSNLYDVAAYDGTYNLPGGAHGAVVSNPIDLRGYSADDLPTLYFNYFLATENSNSDLDNTGRMRDAFRVYGAAEDGNWVLLATNNTPDDQTLNRNNHTGNVDWDEFDNDINKNGVINANENFDVFGNPLQTQEAFDGTGWRQIRTSLSAFAGKENVRLRFEFSTAASFETGDPLRGGQELIAVAGSKLVPGSGFQVQPLDGAFGVTTNFQFDMGLVLHLPSAAALTDGVSTLVINGNTITFSTTNNTGNNIQYSATDSPATLANKVRLRLPAIVPGITGIATNSLRSNVLNVAGLPDGTAATYTASADLPPIIQAFPQATPGVSKIPVTQDMTVAQVRDAIRTALANDFSDPANLAGTTLAQRLAIWKFHDNTIQLYKYAAVNNTSALGITNERFGDYFGVNSRTPQGGAVAFSHMDERAQNNANEGLYIDDIIIGFAERGEMVFSATANNTFAANRQYAKTLYNIDQTETGRYQLTVRTAADYGTTDPVNGRLALTAPFGRQFNTNDRLTQQLGIDVTAAAAGGIPDGATFTLSDGGAPVTFEFDVANFTPNAASGVQPGNVPIQIHHSFTRQQIATAIRDAINSPTVQGLLKVTASLQGEMTYGSFFGDVALSGATTVLLHGQIATDDDGSFTFPANTLLTGRVWGSETGFGEDLGDSERIRPQGQVLLVGNTITNSSQYGIYASAGNRDQSAIGDAVGNRPYPGAPISFPTPNTSQLAPGVVIVNNIVAYNTAGGIRLQGEAGSDAPGQIARVLNNTIYGVAGADNGILIENNATPTILNNIIANSGAGVRAPVGSSAVLGANVYQSNTTNTVNVGVGSFPETLAPGAPLFVDVTNRRFYLAPGSQAIDSSVEALQERPALAQVKNAIGLPESPMLAPDLDVTGQRRVDDPTVNTPAGLGGNVFKDRGAVDRSDFIGLDAILLQPQDNDAQVRDVDRNTTYIQLQSGTLDFFSILLQDNNGTGPDPKTVVSSAVGLTENGRLLTEGVDYVFGYNANSRTVRLTPVAGIWRTDSVYEITLINQKSVDLKVRPGSTAVDGHLITVTHAGGTRVFELDNNGAASITGATLVPFTASMSAYEIASRLRTAINTAGIGVTSLTKGDDTITVSGAVSITATGASITTTNFGAIADLAGNPLFANRANALTQFTIVMPDAKLDFGDAQGVAIPVVIAPNTPPVTNGNGARHVLLPVDVPLLALGSLADADANGQPTAAADGDDTDGSAQVALETLGSVGGLTIGLAGPAVLSVPAAAGLSGQTFTITDTAKRPFAPVTFEFATSAVAGSVVIPVAAGDTADEVASKVAAAVNSAVLSGRLTGLAAVATAARVSLGGSASHLIDLTAAPAVSRVPAGNVQIIVPTSVATLADGQTLTVQDAAGRSVTFELNNTDPAVTATPVAAGRVAINVNLATATTADVANAFAAAVDSQVTARRLTLGKASVGAATAAGIPVSIIADDEDGVSFGDVFNAASNPVAVTVVSTGAGLLDAWIDWNRDGDFEDAGERLFSTSQPVSAGSNVFMIQTPATASVGFTTARFRLSALGGLLPIGVGIGGEVEDHLVEIAAGSPPVVQSDSYTTDEDLVGGLSVPRLPAVAGGPQSILANDTDADIVAPAVINPGVNIFVHDQNPATAAIDPVIGPTNGTLTLQRDGSFTYIPNPEFSGTDTFVYNATDGRLISRVPMTVTIVVNPINDPPLAVDDERTTTEDQAYVRSGSEFTANDHPHFLQHFTEAGQVLTLDSAAIITHTLSDLGGVAGLKVRIASQPGQGNYGIRVYTTTADLGAGVQPTVTVGVDRIDVVLNSNVGTPSTVNDFIAALNGNAAAAALVVASLDAGSGATVIGMAATGYSPLLVPPRAFSSFSVANNTLSYTPAPQYSSNIGGPVLIAITIKDDGTAGLPAGLTATSTLTLNIAPVNDSPEFSLPATESPLEDAGFVSVPNFLSNRRPGPILATDEGAGPAVTPGNQTVAYRVTALNPSLFYPGDATATPPVPSGLPKIDANGTLTYRLAENVNRVTPFPAILVEVVGVDSVTPSTLVATNAFDITQIFPAAGKVNSYDGATLRVTDTSGNAVTFELEDAVNLPGVRTTGTVTNTPISFVAGDTSATVNQKIAAAINAVVVGGANPWTGRAYVDTVSNEIRFSGVASVVTAKAAKVNVLDNLFPAVVAGTSSYDGATFTITDTSGDVIVFEFNDTTNAAPATAGVTAGRVAINYTPATTQAELSLAIDAAIKAPPAAILAGLAGTWEVTSLLSGNRLQLGNVSSLALSATTTASINPLSTVGLTAVNPFAVRPTNESIPRTFTITPTAVNDAPEFTLPASTRSEEDQGVVVIPSFVTGIRKGPVTALDEVVQEFEPVRIDANPAAFTATGYPTIDSATGELRYETARNFNAPLGILVDVTFIDKSGTANGGADRTKKTFTLFVTERNDSPDFDMPTAISAFQEVPDPVGTITTVDPFITNIRSGPGAAGDEASQTVTFVATALKPSLFFPGDATATPPVPNGLPRIDANGRLTYRLAVDVNQIVPFPTILVQVIASDNGTIGNGQVVINRFNPAYVSPSVPNIYDGATLNVVDSNGNRVIFELNDAGLPGVGTTGGFPHVAINFDATDTQATLNQKIIAAVNAPPAASVNLGAIGPWVGRAFVDAATQEIKFTSTTSVVTNTPPPRTILENLFPTPAVGTSYDGATFTLTDIDGDSITFEFNDTTNTAPATAGVGLGHVAINYTPATTRDQLTQAIHNAINNPPAPLAATWNVTSILPTGSHRLQLSGVVNVMRSAAANVIVAVETLEPVFAVRDANTSAPRTFTILPDPINDPPEFTIQPNLLASSYPEDQSAVTITDFIVDARPGPLTALDELLSQQVRVHSITSAAGAFEQLSVTVDPATGKGNLTFKTNKDVNSASHDLTVVVTLKDGNEATNPDVQFTSKTFTITVDPINDLPEFSIPVTQVTRIEDIGSVSVPGFATNILAGPITAIDETTHAATRQTFNFVRVSNSNDGLFEELPTISPTGELRFKSKPHQNGSSVVIVRLVDDGTVPTRLPSDSQQSIADQTFTITLDAINDAPTFRIARPAVSLEDAGVVVIPGFLADVLPGPVEATDEATQILTITATPVDPSVFTQFSLAADGTLTYRTKPDLNNLNANFSVEVYVTDNGLAGPAPNSNRSATQTFTIDVTPVNDEPSFQLLQSQVDVIEDVQNAGLARGQTIIPGFAFNIQRGPATATDEVSQVLNPFEIISVSAPERFLVLPAIDLATGNLSFTTAENKNGKAVVVVRLTDQGASSPAPNDNASILHTFTISIDPINDAPQFTIPTELTVDEDAGLISRNGFASGVRRGPVGSDDENSQLINFDVRALNPALFSVQPAIGVDGTLTFQTANNVNSAHAQLLVEVTLMDNGLNAPPPNVNRSDTRTFTIVVNPVNDPPTTDSFTATVVEDSSVVIQAADVLVGDLPGPTSDELGQTLRMTQVQRTSLQGGQITPVFDPLDPTRIISMTYTPPSNLVGVDTFLYVITDNGSPERSGTGTITMSISGINDPPRFNRGTDQAVIEDAPAVSVANWATGIFAGPPSAADELATQTVSFTVVAANPGLFAVQPQISSSGTLTYTLAKDANGSTAVTVTAIDSGSGVFPNNNTSPPQTFTITISPVNDAPVFTVGGNVNVVEDSGAYAQPWATNIAPAAGLLATPPTATDEAGQLVEFEVSVDRPAMFAVQPRISSAGLLEFTTARDAFGPAVIVVTAVDRGPAGTLDQPRSASQTFTITIAPSNDAPVAVGDNYATDEDSPLAVSPPGLLQNDTDVDLPLDTLTVIAGTFTSDLGATVTINADGSMSYDPRTVAAFQQLTSGQSISDTFTYKIRDAAGAESAPATVTIAINGVDDPPVAVDDDYAIGVGLARDLDVLTNDTDVDSTIDPRTIVIKANPGFGTVRVNQTGVITYTPEGGFRGNDSFRYTVKDTAGNESNEAEVRLVINSAPTASNDSAFTFKGQPVDINVLSNDRDIDGTLNPATVRIEVSPGSSGTAVVLPSGAIRFTPANGFAGNAQFAYSVQDNTGTSSNVANVTVRVANSRWQNPQGNLDVNGDGFVSAIDALLIINYLNGDGERFLPASNVTAPPYIDPTGDELVSPLDVLSVINFLNENSLGGGQGEGEAPATTYAMLVTPRQMVDTVGPAIVREIQSVLHETLPELLGDGIVSHPAKPNLAASPVPAVNYAANQNRDDELITLLSSPTQPIDTSIDDAIDEMFGGL